MKFNPMVAANAAAAVMAVVYVVCRVAFLVLPELSLTVAQSWFHGIAIGTLGAPEITIGSFVLGLATAAGGSWLVGYLFAWTYNQFLKGK